MDITTNRISRCCKAPIDFYDWFICTKCGEFIHDPKKDADPPTAEETKGMK